MAGIDETAKQSCLQKVGRGARHLSPESARFVRA
jgi:hypothetical protein